MLLSHDELVELVEQGVIGPVDPDCINAASIDVTLGDEIFVESYAGGVVSLLNREQLPGNKVNIRNLGHYDLRPGEFILACTEQTFNLPLDICAEFKLKSSGARIGLENALATWCDNGWNNSVLTLELKNLLRFHSIRLHPGVRIGQMLFYRTKPVSHDRSYAKRGRYNGDAGVQGVKL